MNANVIARTVRFETRFIDPETDVRWLSARGCASFADYCSWPDVVEFEGLRFVKTGWNSDFATVHYRQATASDLIAFPVVH